VLRDRLPHFAGGWLSVGRREREQVEARVRFSDPLDLVSFPPLGPGPSVHCGRCGCGLGCEDWSRGGVGSLFWLSVVHPCRRLSTRSQTRGSLIIRQVVGSIPTCPTLAEQPNRLLTRSKSRPLGHGCVLELLRTVALWPTETVLDAGAASGSAATRSRSGSTPARPVTGKDALPEHHRHGHRQGRVGPGE
jgi:hypothetical protein